jgi:hypothetical protein
VRQLTPDQVLNRWLARGPGSRLPDGTADHLMAWLDRLDAVGLAVADTDPDRDPGADLEPELMLPTGMFPDPDNPGQYLASLHRVPADGTWEVCVANGGGGWRLYRGGARQGSAIVHVRRLEPPKPRWVVAEGDTTNGGPMAQMFPWLLQDRGTTRARFSNIDLANTVRDLLASLDTNDKGAA